MNTIEEEIRPFDSIDLQYTVKYTPFFTQLTLAKRQPEGMLDRFENGEFETADVEFLEYIMSNFTDIDSEVVDNLSATQFLYLVTVTMNAIVGEETESFEQFKEETEIGGEMFMNNGSLGVQ